ncbi:hypothetical protein [Bacillus sp. FSL K6-3431]|uniref:hypothetical protein n=1 Tax=Bacillus sp. FSL K6-3431 TaxID=2921500 RepID=UPI0030F78C8D
MAYIYLLNGKLTYDEVASRLKQDSRIGFMAWKEDGMNLVRNTELDGNLLLFRLQGNYQDAYGQSWKLSGNTSVLDIKINNHRNINYGDYPDALARLHGSLHSHKGRFLIVDAKPGFEFSG